MSDDTLAIFCVFGLPICSFIIIRVLKHRERMEMIRHGMMPPGDGRGGRRGWYGPPGTYPPGAPPAGGNWPENERDAANRSLHKGVKLTLVGLAILIGLSFIGYDTHGPLGTARIEPGPWLLGGLVPMFVGFAQIIVALLSGAQWRPPQASPGGGPPPYTGGTVPPSGPSVYEPEPRTHSGYEELRRPPQPPERRP